MYLLIFTVQKKVSKKEVKKTGGGAVFFPNSAEAIIVNGLVGTAKVSGIPGFRESGKDCIVTIS